MRSPAAGHADTSVDEVLAARRAPTERASDLHTVVSIAGTFDHGSLEAA